MGHFLFGISILVIGLIATTIGGYIAKEGWEKWHGKNSLKIETVIKSDPTRDKIIAQQYFYALSEFLVKFRFNLHCLIPSNVKEPEIEEAFHYGADMLKTAPNLDKITENVIKDIFTKYDFRKPAINFTPHPGQRMPTNTDLLIGELAVLNKKCNDILTKYASSGNPALIQDIEIIKNRTDNLIGPFGLHNNSVTPKNSLNNMTEFFDLFKKSIKLSTELK